MAQYYVVRDKNTGLYFRGKGVNRWGKYYNQASIYRIKANAENTIKEVSWRGEQAEVVPIQIIESTVDVVPKSEVDELKAIIADHKASEERLEEELAKANADVKNYMKVAEYQQGLSVKRYHEIKRLNEDIERLQKSLDDYEETSGLKQAKAEVEVLEAELSRYTENVKQMCEQAKAEVARDIFEEIELKMFCNQYEHIPFGSSDRVKYYDIDLKDAIAELKKKYIPKDCRDCKHMLSCEPALLGICDEYEEADTKEEGEK